MGFRPKGTAPRVLQIEHRVNDRVNRFDVVVIGGGLAGLVAARDLVRSGRKVAILEARHRLGGRVRTVRTMRTSPVELGAEFVHGRPAVTLRLIEEAGLSLVEVGARAVELTSRGLEPNSKLFEHAESVLSALSASGSDDRSFASWLSSQRLDPVVRAHARSYVEGFFAAFGDRVGTAGLAREQRATAEHGDSTYRIREGYGELVDHLARTSESVTIRLATRVLRVAWSSTGLSIDALGPSGGYRCEARQAVVTLPLGVLRRGAPNGVQFEPALEDKVAAACRLDPGLARRITLELREPFWYRYRDASSGALEGVDFVHTPGLPMTVFWTGSPDSGPTLTCWAGGPAAAAIHPDTLEAAACETVARALGCPINEVRNYLSGSHAHDWIGDVDSAGVYAYALVGGLDASQELARSVEDVLFFAGEATHHEGELGTTAAAIATGHRAAHEIVSGARL